MEGKRRQQEWAGRRRNELECSAQLQGALELECPNPGVSQSRLRWPGAIYLHQSVTGGGPLQLRYSLKGLTVEVFH